MDDGVAAFRAVDNLVSGIGYVILGGTGSALLTRRGIGHKFLIASVTVFCFMKAMANFFGAYSALVHHSPITASLVYLLGGVSGLILCGTVLASWNDLLTTLRTSESEDRLRKDQIANNEQARLQLEYLNIQSRLRSDELLRDQREEKERLRIEGQ